MTRIIIADDHRMVAEGIARLIADSNAAEVVATAATLDEAARLLEEHRPEVLLLDVALPDGDGIDAIPRLLEASPATHVVVLSMYAEPTVVRRAMEAHAHGYVLKSSGSQELIEAINAAAADEVYICQEAAQLMKSHHEELPTLTAREREVLRLIVEGKTMKEIAEELFLGFETIHSYTKYLRQKLGCNNTASLVRIALERHLI